SPAALERACEYVPELPEPLLGWYLDATTVNETVYGQGVAGEEINQRDAVVEGRLIDSNFRGRSGRRERNRRRVGYIDLENNRSLCGAGESGQRQRQQ